MRANPITSAGNAAIFDEKKVDEKKALIATQKKTEAIWKDFCKALKFLSITALGCAGGAFAANLLDADTAYTIIFYFLGISFGFSLGCCFSYCSDRPRCDILPFSLCED